VRVKACEVCGKQLTGAQLRFCSRECKEAARSAGQKIERLAVKAASGRICDECGKPIPPSMTGSTRFCSRECGIAHHNKELAAAKHAVVMERRAARPPCKRCGEPIPGEMRIGTIYCSRECRVQANLVNWRERSPDYMRRYLYGISPEQWQETWEAQKGTCAICGTDDWRGKHGKPVTDHDHDTHVFRGILCNECNQGLGKFKHDPERLRVAIKYLEDAITQTRTG